MGETGLRSARRWNRLEDYVSTRLSSTRWARCCPVGCRDKSHMRRTVHGKKWPKMRSTWEWLPKESSLCSGQSGKLSATGQCDEILIFFSSHRPLSGFFLNSSYRHCSGGLTQHGLSFYPAQDSSLRCSLLHAAWRVASQLLPLPSKPSVLLIDSVSAWQGAQVVPRSSYLLHVTSIKSFYFKGRRRKVSDFLNYNNLPKQVFLPNATHFPIKMLSTHCSLLLFELS